MYDFKKLENEFVKNIIDDCILLTNNVEKNITVIITNMRLLFLDYPNSGIQEDLRISRGLNYSRKKELFFEIKLEDIKEIEKGEFNKYILKDTNYFYLKSDEVLKIINKKDY